MPGDRLLVGATARVAVPAAAAEEYRRRRRDLVDEVNRTLGARPDLSALIGGRSLAVMEGNHENHADFVHAVLALGSGELMAATLPWVYRAYMSHGFSADYFPVELSAWIDAIRARLEPTAARAILPLYEWMLSEHGDVLALSGQLPPRTPSVPVALHGTLEAFLGHLVSGDGRAAQALAEAAVPTLAELGPFYLSVVGEAMVRVGEGWERGRISVAQEHQAGIIAGRVLWSLYARHVQPIEAHRGLVMTAAAPGERHAMGVWMVGDLLAADGWEVATLGADTPVADLVAHAAARRPRVVALSASMPYHLVELRQAIRELRARPELATTKILVGGQAFAPAPQDLRRRVGGDGYAPEAVSACTLVRELAGEAPPPRV